VATEVGFRISDWDSPLRPGEHRSPGRYHRAESPPTQYISLHPLAPWAEYLRYHDLRRLEDAADRRLRVWALRVNLTNAVEISFEGSFEEFGIRRENLVGDDHTACQDLADRLRADAAAPKEILVPSAALPGARNLVILGPREQIPYLWTPIDAGDIPACIVTEASRPPEGLLDRVRFVGDSHAELEAWEQGWRYELADLESES
jgi:RES domain-containing protein